jgi:hypothetical protein
MTNFYETWYEHHASECHSNAVISFFFMAQQPLLGQGLLIIEATLRHTTLGRTPLDE